MSRSNAAAPEADIAGFLPSDRTSQKRGGTPKCGRQRGAGAERGGSKEGREQRAESSVLQQLQYSEDTIVRVAKARCLTLLGMVQAADPIYSILDLLFSNQACRSFPRPDKPKVVRQHGIQV